MKKPNPDHLVAYLYGETDESTSKSISQEIAQCEETKSQVADWQATMQALDQWKLDEVPVQKPSRSFARFAGPMLKAAAAVAVLVGTGMLLEKRQSATQSDSLANVASAPPSSAAIDALVEERFAEERAKLIASQEAIRNELILASGAMTHQQIQSHVEEIQSHVQGTLTRLKQQDTRNATLAMLLPTEERKVYHKKRVAREKLATEVVLETERAQELTQLILSRAQRNTH